MAAGTLVDTSAFYALLDENEPFHAQCKLAFAEAPSPPVTTPAVLTELFHFLVRRFRNQEGGWRLLRSGQFELSPISTADLPALDKLMHRYADRPMDFADATLVHVAEREGLNHRPQRLRDLSHWTQRQVPDITRTLSRRPPRGWPPLGKLWTSGDRCR